MSKEKHRHKKKRYENGTNDSGDPNERPNSSLFNEADAKSVEVSGYTVGHGAPQTDQLTEEKIIPTGVAVVDKSIKLPDTPPDMILRSNENYPREYVHLPPISHHSHHHPYGYIHPSPDPNRFGYLSYPYTPYYNHYSPDHHSQHHHRHHHHHHHHHHHEKAVETYDPRWWYMPINSVHRPKPWRPPNYHYQPPKWYESSGKQNRLRSTIQESKSPTHKYADCRCEVCRPAKETPRGTRWVVNE